jgi:hypothetical protein
MQWITESWPWWFSGVLIGLVVPMLQYLAGRDFGISTSLQQIGALCAPKSRLDYLKSHHRRDGMWLIYFVGGLALGGFIGSHLLSHQPIEFLPSWSESPAGLLRLLGGGVLIGFGARYANGCTSGHSVTGMANLNAPSYLATCCFLAGGLAVTWALEIF